MPFPLKAISHLATCHRPQSCSPSSTGKLEEPGGHMRCAMLTVLNHVIAGSLQPGQEGAQMWTAVRPVSYLIRCHSPLVTAVAPPSTSTKGKPSHFLSLTPGPLGFQMSPAFPPRTHMLPSSPWLRRVCPGEGQSHQSQAISPVQELSGSNGGYV